MNIEKTPPYGLSQEPLDAAIHITGLPKIQMACGVISDLTTPNDVLVATPFTPISFEVFAVCQDGASLAWSHGVASPKNSSVVWQKVLSDGTLACGLREGIVINLAKGSAQAVASAYRFGSTGVVLKFFALTGLTCTLQWKAWGW